jgi:PAS domain S-box-containing protein
VKLSPKHLFAGVVLLGGLILFYLKTNRIVFGEHERFDGNVHRLAQMDATLNQDVLKARFRLLEHYDGFPEQINELKRTADDLAAIPSFISDPGGQALRQKADVLSQILVQKEELLERFKSQNAVLNNSLRYLPVMGSELIALASADEQGREVKGMLEGLMQQVLTYSLQSSTDQIPGIQSSLANLAEWRSRHGDYPQDEALANLVAHVNSIVRRKPKVEALIEQIVSLPINRSTEDLMHTYDGLFSAALRTADLYRIALYLLCASLIVGIGYTIYALVAANAHLERRVVERTRDLSRKNEQLQSEIAERQRTEQAIQQLQHEQELVFNSISEGIHWIDKNGRIVFENPAAARMLGWDASELIGRPAHSTMHHTRADGSPYPQCECRIYEGLRTGATLHVTDEMFWRKDGTGFPVAYTSSPVRDEKGELIGAVVVFTDITLRRQAEAELELTHRKLRDASREAGMAEVATNVLHNVGNVLNSVNTSISIAALKVTQLKTAGLTHIAALLNEHSEDLPTFFTEHPQGIRLPRFLNQLTEHFTKEQNSVLGELESLRENCEHINEIVAMQQSYAGAGGVMETVPLFDVIENALRMNAAAFERHGTEVVRELDSALPPVAIDRNKLLLILVNLLRNAKYACDDAGHVDKRITVRTQSNDHGFAQISVSDNGVGIPAENLTRIFAHGFTTRKGGHGFGLHSSALAATEMGGSLRVHSDGPGRGATFIIDLPLSMGS